MGRVGLTQLLMGQAQLAWAWLDLHRTPPLFSLPRKTIVKCDKIKLIQKETTLQLSYFSHMLYFTFYHDVISTFTLPCVWEKKKKKAWRVPFESPKGHNQSKASGGSSLLRRGPSLGYVQLDHPTDQKYVKVSRNIHTRTLKPPRNPSFLSFAARHLRLAGHGRV